MFWRYIGEDGKEGLNEGMIYCPDISGDAKGRIYIRLRPPIGDTLLLDTLYVKYRNYKLFTKDWEQA